jgi:hypothetical protein
MRKIVPECRALDSTPIEEIVIDPKMRDDMSAVLKGLQHVYCDPELRASMFTLLETHFQPGTRKDVGRPGMDLWRLLVFAIVKQCLDLDYDALLYRANNDLLLRELLGHGEAGFDALKYTRQRLVDNVQLLSPELILGVIELIVRAGHGVARKKSGAALRGRCDSRVVKTHVHFPTDVSLLWDSVRGLIRSCVRAATAFDVPGWRKHADRRRKVYAAFNKVRTAARYRRNPKGVKAYLKLCQKNATRARVLLEALAEVEESAQAQAEIRGYLDYVELFADQVRRRILDGEKIPHEEKVFSIHKPHTRWINKGKAGVVAELGIPVAVVEDEYQFILAYHILWTGSDVDVAVPLIDAVQATYPAFTACSFDRAFHSPKNRTALDARLTMNALPKKGKLNRADRVRQSDPAFLEARRQHPAVESCLANFGLRGGALVREKSKANFALMVGLSVLAVNVHRLGCLVRNQERARNKRRQRRAA